MYMREVDDPVTIQYIILFTLAEAKRKVTHSQLTCLTLDSCNINFTNFQIALDNLVQIEYIRKLSNPIDEKMPIYELTQKGTDANSFFANSIPIYIREQIKEHIEPYFAEEKLKKSIKATLVPINENEYNVECALYESVSPLLEISFYAGTREIAARIARNFKANPEKVYKEIFESLLGDEDE